MNDMNESKNGFDDTDFDMARIFYEVKLRSL